MKTKWKIIIILSAVVIAGVLGVVIWKMNDTSTPEPTPPVVNTPTSVPTDSATPEPTDSPTPLPTPTLSPTPVPTDTPTPEPTPTEELTPTKEPTPTEEPEPTDSPTPEPTNTATPSPTQKPAELTKEPTKVPTKEPTKAPTNTVTPKPTKAPTPTFTPTPVPAPTEAPLLANPITMWIAVDDFCVYDKDVYMSTDPHKMQKIDNQGKKCGDTVVVIRRNVNFATSEQSYIDEIQWNGGTALVRENHLSMTHVEPVWAEPRERKDVADALARLIDNYRLQNGIRKVENPYVYYDVTNPGTGDRITAHALRVAKKCCMEGTANHEGGQIGTGIYGGAHDVPMSAEECANALFDNWYNSPAHRANMLDNMNPDSLVLVGTVKVVEWYNGNGYQYCAIQEIVYIPKENLPDGLE